MDTVKKPLIIIFCPVSNGGLAEHVYYQAKSCCQLGHSVVCLVPPRFLGDRPIPFPVKRILYESSPSAQMPSFIRKLLFVWAFLMNYLTLSIQILRNRPKVVLLDSYREYFAPLWAWAIRKAMRVSNSICVANLHDPVRNYQVGPAWWHQWSVKCGYSFIHVGLVHSPPPPEANLPAHIQIIEVPVGIYDLLPPKRSYERIRKDWGVTSDQFVFLCFGFIRDNKNIDLLIQSLKYVKQAFLVIAGSTQSQVDRPVEFYKNLAKELGVIDRCYFFSDFIADEQVPDYFYGCDFVSLTYSSTFFSQSGVLNLAAAAKKPVLASSAESPLLQVVRKFRLGEAVAPDSRDAIIKGMNSLMSNTIDPDWKGYSSYAGWERNVTAFLKAANMNVS
ncbi:glycosyltransferase family 4 protein [Longitalea luteola]|uniref:glycosyltransferase family 4 protein n=1 Tax=Longitalea luteola TaxID=2812563 RepID=UPI001A971FB5|nr:glycosyltransferase family 4 protein [Longitalea luteola]